MASTSQVRVPPPPEGLGEEHSGIDLESIDEDVVVSSRMPGETVYRGLAPWIFFTSAAGFALVAATVAAGIALAVMSIQIGAANERWQAAEAVAATKAEDYARTNLEKVACQGELKALNSLLDRVAPGSRSLR